MLTSSNAAAAVISFLTLLISTIYNPLEVLGVYGVFVVTVASFSQLVAGRLEHAIVRSASKRAALEIKRASFTLSAGIMLTIIALYLLCAMLNIIQFDYIITITLFSILSSGWWNISVATLNYEERYRAMSVVHLAKSLFLLLTIGSVSILADNAFFMCIAYLSTTFCTSSFGKIFRS